jgi:NAD-dependent dihydropyrimidine dehydrogenase PreA subunit
MGKIGPGGFSIAYVSNPETCNACGICGFMCPDMAIDVYKYVAGR